MKSSVCHKFYAVAAGALLYVAQSGFVFYTSATYILDTENSSLDNKQVLIETIQSEGFASAPRSPYGNTDQLNFLTSPSNGITISLSGTGAHFEITIGEAGYRFSGKAKDVASSLQSALKRAFPNGKLSIKSRD